ncbi:MAG: YfbM family protein [Planctomycetota bacterium]
MSMIGCFLLVDDERLQRLMNEPEQVHDVCDDAYDAGDGVFADVDKAWHCIHYLLTGSADAGDSPLNFVMSGGAPVGVEDVGYGPARAFRAVELAEIATALASIDHAKLADRFDPQQMDRLEIYPDAGRWSEVDPRSQESFGYYSGAFDSIKSLVEHGVRSGAGLLVWLS